MEKIKKSDKKLFKKILRKVSINELKECGEIEINSLISEFVRLLEYDGKELGYNNNKIISMPKINNEELDLENIEFINLNENSITFLGGGDWQNPTKVTLELKNDNWNFFKGEIDEEKLPISNTKDLIKHVFNCNDDDLDRLSKFEDNVLFSDDDDDDSLLLEFFEQKDKLLNKKDSLNESENKSDNKEIFSGLEKIYNIDDLSEEDIKEVEKELSENLVFNGKKSNVKVNKKDKKLRPVKIKEIKEFIDNQTNSRFILYKWEKDKDNSEKVINPSVIEGTQILSTNTDEEEIMVWLDNDPQTTFNLNTNNEGEIDKIEYENEVFSLFVEYETTTVRIKEENIECADLRNEDDFQKFLNSIEIYDQDRMKLDNMRKYYSDEMIEKHLKRMQDVGYILESKKFQSTGDSLKDYYFTLTNKFLRTKKFRLF